MCIDEQQHFEWYAWGKTRVSVPVEPERPEVVAEGQAGEAPSVE